MSIIRWKPFKEVDELLQELQTGVRHNGWDLAADVWEDENTVYVEMHTPGIDPDKVDIEVEDNHLHVAGSREEEKETEDKDFYRKEIRRGSFERVIDLPASVIAEKTKAEFRDGVLCIELPKRKATPIKKIKVEKK